MLVLVVGVPTFLCHIQANFIFRAALVFSSPGADGHTWLALADAKYLGAADQTDSLHSWLAVFK